MAMDPKTREQMAGSAGIRDHKRFSDQQLRNLKGAQGRTRDRLMAKYLRENKEATAPKPKPRTQSSAPTSSSRPPSRPTSTDRATPEASRAREAHGRSRVERDSSTSPRPQPRPEKQYSGRGDYGMTTKEDDLDNTIVDISKRIMEMLPEEDKEGFVEAISAVDEIAKTPAERVSIWLNDIVFPMIAERHQVSPEYEARQRDQVTPGAPDRMPVPEGMDQPYVRRTVPNETLGQQIEEDRRLRIEAQSMFPRDLPPEQPQSYKKGGLVSRRKK